MIEFSAASNKLEFQTNQITTINDIDLESNSIKEITQADMTKNDSIVLTQNNDNNVITADVLKSDFGADEEEVFEIHCTDSGDLKFNSHDDDNGNDDNDEKNYDLSDSDHEEFIEPNIVKNDTPIKLIEKAPTIPKLNLKTNQSNNEIKKSIVPPQKLSNRTSTKPVARGVLTQNSNKTNVLPLASNSKKISIEDKVKLALAEMKHVVKKKTEKVIPVFKSSDAFNSCIISNSQLDNKDVALTSSLYKVSNTLSKNQIESITELSSEVNQNSSLNLIMEDNQEPDDASSWVSPWEKSGENARDYLKQAILAHNLTSTDSTDYSSSLAAVRNKLKSVAKKSYLQDPELDGMGNGSNSGYSYSSSNSLSGQLLLKLEKSFNLNIEPKSFSPRFAAPSNTMPPIQHMSSLSSNLGKIPPLNFSKLKK